MTRFKKYAVVGGLLSLGSPVGLLAARRLSRRSTTIPPVEDLRADALACAYSTLGTLIVLTTFGAALGRIGDRLSALSITDPLTGLANRRELDRQLDYWIHYLRRHTPSVTLLLIDVDHLKQINDRRGHAAGDATLVRVAAALRHTLRRTDIPARLGGDEFCVLAPLTDMRQAWKLAFRIRQHVSAQSGGAESVSIGIATLTQADVGTEPLTKDRLLGNADAALYRAKLRGGGRIDAA